MATTAPAAPAVSAVGRRDLPSLTSLRAIAALAVFCFHAQLLLWIPGLYPLGTGYAGVSVFFVLSGFILTWTYRPEQSARQFYLRRFARVYPSHIAVIAAIVLISVVIRVDVPAGRVLWQVLLLQPWAWSPELLRGGNEPSWSLGAEAFFYAMFPAVVSLFMRMKARTMWIVVSVALVGYAVVVAVASRNGDAYSIVVHLVYHNPLIRLPEFLWGMALGNAFISGFRVRLWHFLLAAAAAAALHIGLPQAFPSANLWAALLAGVVIVFLGQRDANGKLTLLTAKPLQLAGKMSFAFYLVHLPLLLAAWRTYGRTLAVTVASFAAACAAAMTLHYLVEVPANRWILVRFGPQRRR